MVFQVLEKSANIPRRQTEDKATWVFPEPRIEKILRADLKVSTALPSPAVKALSGEAAPDGDRRAKTRPIARSSVACEQRRTATSDIDVFHVDRPSQPREIIKTQFTK